MIRSAKSYCSLPWVNISTDPDGSIKPCCISTDFATKIDGTRFNLGYDTLDEIYNSEYFQSLRQKMLDGVEIEGCKKCYENERLTGTSSRMVYNRTYPFNYDQSKLNKVKIKYFDLRFGNLCNLKCRSCNPTASNQIAKEIEEINDPVYSAFHTIPIYDMNNWYNTKTFIDNIESQIENINMIYLTGGEPTLNENNKKFLKKLVTEGNTRITIKISTNLTNLNKEFFELLSNFSNVIFFASIDGYCEIQEYLRYPSNWKKIDENIKAIITQNNFLLIATPVVQIGNINKIVDLFDYFENFNIENNRLVAGIDPILLEYPHYLNIKYLPLDFKIRCWEKIENWLINNNYHQPESFKQKLFGIKKVCYENHYDIEKINTYKVYNDILDKNRNNFLIDVNKELYEEIYK